MFSLNFSKPKLDDSIIEKFVSQIIPVDNFRYRWDLNFLPNKTQSFVCKVEGRKNIPVKAKQHKSWGELSGGPKELENRNKKIMLE